MLCYKPVFLKKEKILVPCGHCFACRFMKSREWAARCRCELQYWKDACFITLTYAPEFLPSKGSLVVSDLQKFFKRLRRHIDFKIKYFACGEYGGQFGRPHYHAIVYGLRNDVFTKRLIFDVWAKGRTDVGYCTKDSIGYVVGYVMKKYSKSENEAVYTDQGLKIPFLCASRGLGLRYLEDNSERLRSDLEIKLYDGTKVPLPRYFADKLCIDPEVLKARGAVKSVDFITGLFNRCGISLDPNPDNFIKMLYYEPMEDYDLVEPDPFSSNGIKFLDYNATVSRIKASAKLNQVFDDLCDQRRHNWIKKQEISHARRLENGKV